MSDRSAAGGEQVLDRLFDLPLDEFVGARNAAAKKAAAEGDTVGAARLRGLSKPTVAAWVVNQVARSHPDEVAHLVALGDELRAATAARDRAHLTELDRERRRQVDALVGEVSHAGEVGGRAVSGEVLRRLGETLTAAVLDPDAGDLVRAGRLTQALQYVGFGIVDESGESADVVSLSAERDARRRGAARAVEGSEDAASDGDATDGTTQDGTALDDALSARAISGRAAHGDPVDRTTAGQRPGASTTRSAPDTATDPAVDTGPDTSLDATEREVAEAAAELDRVEGRRDQAAAEVREASDAVGPLDAQLSALDEQIARLTAEREDARAALDEARSALTAAEEELAAVDRDVEAAEERAEEARRRRRAARAKG
jgi:flagellar biosynthesis chaperone FliJ